MTWFPFATITLSVLAFLGVCLAARHARDHRKSPDDAFVSHRSWLQTERFRFWK